MAENEDDITSPPSTIEEAEERVRLYPGYYASHAWLGELYYREGMYEEAIAPLKRAAVLFQERIRELLMQQIASGSEPGILAFLSDPTPLEKPYRMVLMMLADSLQKLQRYQDAISELTEGLTMASEDPELWSILGVLQHQIGDSEKALRSFREAVLQDPSRQDLWENLHKGYLSIGRLEAKLISEPFIEKGDSTREKEIDRLSSQFGDAESRNKMTQSVIEEAKLVSKALVKNRSLEANMALLVELFIGAGEYSKAQSTIERVIERKRKDKRILLPSSKLHIIDGEYMQAQEKLEKFIKSDKHNLEGLWHLARVYAIQGKTKDSLKFLERLLKSDTANFNALELQRMLTTSPSMRDVEFGVFTWVEAGRIGEKIHDEMIFSYGLSLPVGSTIEDAVHIIFKEEYDRILETGYLKSVKLSILSNQRDLLHDVNTSCIATQLPLSSFSFKEYKGVEPYSLSATMHEPDIRKKTSLTSVILPNALFSLFETSMSELQLAGILSMYTTKKDEIKRKLAEL